MTFFEMCDLIASLPVCTFETDYLISLNSHKFIQYQRTRVLEMIQKGANPKKNWACIHAKKLVTEALEAIQENRQVSQHFANWQDERLTHNKKSAQ